MLINNKQVPNIFDGYVFILTALIIAIYVKRAFYNPLTERRKFSRPRKIFAERDSERNAFTLPFLSRDLQIFFESWKISTSGSGS